MLWFQLIIGAVGVLMAVFSPSGFQILKRLSTPAISCSKEFFGNMFILPAPTRSIYLIDPTPARTSPLVFPSQRATGHIPTKPVASVESVVMAALLLFLAIGFTLVIYIGYACATKNQYDLVPASPGYNPPAPLPTVPVAAAGLMLPAPVVAVLEADAEIEGDIELELAEIAQDVGQVDAEAAEEAPVEDATEMVIEPVQDAAAEPLDAEPEPGIEVVVEVEEETIVEVAQAPRATTEQNGDPVQATASRDAAPAQAASRLAEFAQVTVGTEVPVEAVVDLARARRGTDVEPTQVATPEDFAAETATVEAISQPTIPAAFPPEHNIAPAQGSTAVSPPQTYTSSPSVSSSMKPTTDVPAVIVALPGLTRITSLPLSESPEPMEMELQGLTSAVDKGKGRETQTLGETSSLGEDSTTSDGTLQPLSATGSANPMNVVDCTLDALSPTPATLHHWESATAGPSETAPDYSSYNSSVDIGTPSSDPYQAGREFYRPHQQWQEENRNIYDRRTPRLPHPPMSGPIPSAQYMPSSMGPPFHPRISNHNGEYPGPPPGINEPSYGNGYGYGNKYGYGRGQGYGYEYGQRHDVGQGRWNGPLVAPYHAPPPLNQFMNPPPPFPHQYAPMPPPTPFAPNGPLPPAFLGMPPSFGGMPMHMHAPLPTYPPLPMAPISPGYSTVQGQPMYMAESSPPTQDMRTTYGAPRQMVPPPFHVREGTVSPSGTTYFNGILPLR